MDPVGAAFGLGGAAIGTILALYLLQNRMIYHRRRYPAQEAGPLPEGVEAIEFHTAEGRQTAFLARPSCRSGPPKLWVLLGGNGSLALEWVPWMREAVPHGACLLLVDYPGYGWCEGQPGEEPITRAVCSAFEAAADALGEEAQVLAQRSGVIGYSLGCAAALVLAERYPLRQVILLAPFTRLRDVAALRVGWPLNLLVRDRFDNRAALQRLSLRDAPPQVTIVHGTEDRVVPFRMGSRLAAAHPQWVRFVAVKIADHDTLPDAALMLLQQLTGDAGGEHPCRS
ncbi:MAG: alpha/beta hydrolase [Chthonomonadales bacterium]